MEHERKIKITDNITLVIKEEDETNISTLRGELGLIDKIIKAVDSTVGVATKMRDTLKPTTLAVRGTYKKRGKKRNKWTLKKAKAFLKDLRLLSRKDLASKYNIRRKSTYTMQTKLKKLVNKNE